MSNLYDKDRFPCKGNPEWQQSRAITEYFDEFAEAERTGINISDEKERFNEIIKNINSVFYRNLYHWDKSTRKMVEFINVLCHRQLSWERDYGPDNTVAKHYLKLWKDAHWKYKHRDDPPKKKKA